MRTTMRCVDTISSRRYRAQRESVGTLFHWSGLMNKRGQRGMVLAGFCIALGTMLFGGGYRANAQETDEDAKLTAEIRERYTKYEYRIPMRDGARLFTAVYVPKDASKRYPILLTRTPYDVAPYGVDRYKADLGPSPVFGKAGYIFAYQDVRGRWMSEGEFVNMRP